MRCSLEDLRRGVVLAELGGYGDGPYCARHAAGAALAVMGTYIVDPGDVGYPAAFVFKPGPQNYQEYLQRNIAAARAGVAAVGVSVVCVNPQDDIEFLQTAAEAGANYVSLCLHSVMQMFTSRGLSSAMLRRANWPRLRAHLEAILGAIEAPFIAKIGIHDAEETVAAVAEMVAVGVQIIHANVGDATSAEGLRLIGALKAHAPFLIAGGGINAATQAEGALGAGADAIAIGAAAMRDPQLCGRLQRELRGDQTDNR